MSSTSTPAAMRLYQALRDKGYVVCFQPHGDVVRAKHVAQVFDEAGVSEWQLIETAPKDGTEILCWDGENRAICDYRSGKWNVTQDSEDYGWSDYTPTHWQHLPTPPTETNDR